MAFERASQDELLLNALVDGELAPREHAAAAARLAGDREFARAYATLMCLKATVVEGAEDAGVVELKLPKPRARRLATFAGAGVALAATVVIAVGLWSSWRGAEDPPLADAQPQTVTLASFAQAAVLPDLAPAGLKLAATLIQPGASGQVLVATYLGPRGCRLELRVQPAAGVVITAEGTDRRNWQVDDLVYQLIAFGMPAERFAAVAEAAERATRGGSPGGADRRLREARVSAPPCLA
jgi:hypothetical protein